MGHRPGATVSGEGVLYQEALVSEFGRLAAAIDEAEAIAWDRIGGPTEADARTVEFLERRLAKHPPVTGNDWEWLARRRGRALENGWQGGPVRMIAKLAA